MYKRRIKTICYLIFASGILLLASVSNTETVQAEKPIEFKQSATMNVQDVRDAGELRLSLIVTPNGYFPKRIFARKNIPLRIYITGSGSEESCFLLNIGSYAEVDTPDGRAPASAGSIRRSVKLGRMEEISFIPRKSGEFRFGCPIQGFTGILTVRD
jgi:hypothetical protein